MKFGFFTLGCKVNQYETQAMEQFLTACGHTVGSFDETCDGYVINTCSVTAVADKKNRAVIRRCRREHPNAVIGVCGMIWVMLIPALIYVKQPVYLSILWDGLAVAIYLYMLTFLTKTDTWFWGLALPIAALVTVIAEIFALCVKKLPKSFLTELLYTLSAIALLCLGLEILIDLYLSDAVSLFWSAVVLTVCVVLDIMVITMLSLRRLRDAVRRRLHF